MAEVYIKFIEKLMSEQNSANKRLAKNTIFLYFRMLLLMVITLYTSRVTLQVLGVEDFGIYNIVGGVVILFAFLSRSLNSASSRFLSLAVSTGDECEIQKNFSTILVGHLYLMMIVFFLLETIGLWFVINKLNIPEGKEITTNVVYQLAVISTCLNILRTPFNASVIANEQMNFYAYTGIVEGILKLVVVGVLLVVSFDKLVFYAILMMLSVLIINLWYLAYCVKRFKGNKIILKTNNELLKPILSFSGWNLFNGVADIGWQQGTNIILNMFFGVTLNATMGITNQVRTAIYSFVVNLQMAANPQIIKAYGTKDKKRFEQLVYTISKYSFLMMLFFTVPLCLNMEYVLQLWLVNVPDYTVNFTILILIFSLTDTLSGPLWISVQANGNVKVFSIVYSIILLFNIPVTYLLFYLGYAPEWMLYARILINIMGIIWELLYVHRLVGFNLSEYARQVVCPITVITIITAFLSYIVKDIFDGFSTLILTTIVSSFTLIITTYLCGMSITEKNMVKLYLQKIKINI